MLVAFCCAAASALVCFVMFHSKKTISHVLREIKYEAQFGVVGFFNILDDYMARRRNKLGELPSMDGKIAVITGGARGIGAEVVRTLTECGARVVMGVRKREAGTKMALQFEKAGLKGTIDVYELDVSSLKSVQKFAETVSKQYPKIHYLINNAGIMFGDYKTTVDGFESQLGTNYLGHFYLTHLLMPQLKSGGEGSACSRVVNVSSCAHYPGEIFFDDIHMKLEYITSAAYAQSKLAQIMFARYLDRQLQADGSNVRVFSVHPGVVNTDLFKDSPLGRYAPWFQRLFFKTPLQGSVSILHTCIAEKLETRGGAYISNCRTGMSSSYSKDEGLQKRLFDVTCEMVKVKAFGVVE